MSEVPPETADPAPPKASAWPPAQQRANSITEKVGRALTGLKGAVYVHVDYALDYSTLVPAAAAVPGQPEKDIGPRITRVWFSWKHKELEQDEPLDPVFDSMGRTVTALVDWAYQENAVEASSGLMVTPWLRASFHGGRACVQRAAEGGPAALSFVREGGLTRLETALAETVTGIFQTLADVRHRGGVG